MAPGFLVLLYSPECLTKEVDCMSKVCFQEISMFTGRLGFFNIDANQRKHSFTCLENTVDFGRIRTLRQLSVAGRQGEGRHKTCYAIQR